MSARRCIDWPGLMRIGLGELRLNPSAFWSMTPAEFALASGRDLGGGGGSMTKSALEALVRLYPDRGEPSGDG
ncbi:MAG: rcc01693 family protein [Pseudomonadota bacterium]